MFPNGPSPDEPHETALLVTYLQQTSYWLVLANEMVAVNNLLIIVNRRKPFPIRGLKLRGSAADRGKKVAIAAAGQTLTKR